MGSDASPILIKAMSQDLEEDNLYRSNILKALFWIGNILSHFGTGVLRFIGASKLSNKSLGQIHAYPEWNLHNDQEEADRRRVTEEEWDLWK